MSSSAKLEASLQRFVDLFHEDGFGVIRHAVDQRSVTELRLRLEKLLGPQHGSDTSTQRVAPRIVERHDAFAALATSPPLVAMLTSILGAVPQLVCSYGHNKPAATAAHTGIHSDIAHLVGVPQHLSTLMVKAMYALTPIRTGSGGTVVFPGSHREPTGHTLGSAKGHYVALEPGDLLLFHANIQHSATQNSSTSSRLSIWFMFALPWMRIFPGYEYSSDFLARVEARSDAEPHLRWLYGLADPYAT